MILSGGNPGRGGFFPSREWAAVSCSSIHSMRIEWALLSAIVREKSDWLDLRSERHQILGGSVTGRNTYFRIEVLKQSARYFWNIWKMFSGRDEPVICSPRSALGRRWEQKHRCPGCGKSCASLRQVWCNVLYHMWYTQLVEWTGLPNYGEYVCGEESQTTNWEYDEWKQLSVVHVWK